MCYKQEATDLACGQAWQNGGWSVLILFHKEARIPTSPGEKKLAEN